MGLGLSLGCGLEMQQSLSLQQRLQQNLELKLSQQLEQKIELGQYLEQEDFIQGLIRYADENNTWKRFDKVEFSFTYAALPYEIVKPIVDVTGPGFAHCQYNPFLGREMGQWTLFVVPELIPSELVDIVALHERGEEISFGDHYFASQLEFAFAQKEKKLKPHVEWIDKKYPSKFVDLTQKVHFPILPDELREFLNEQGKRKDIELRSAEELIENYPIPSTVLQKISKYERASETICKRFKLYAGLTQQELMNAFFSRGEKDPAKTADIVEKMMKNTLDIDPSLVRVASHLSVNEAYRFYTELVGKTVFQQTERHLIFPKTFLKAYKTFRDFGELVKVMYIPEDRDRMGK